MSESKAVRSDDLLDAIGQAIVDLSVHPAGCDDWRFYEQLCLEVADRLNMAYQASKAANDEFRGGCKPSSGTSCCAIHSTEKEA